jgi:antitoxin component of MazEF toxin-antitoxin module
MHRKSRPTRPSTGSASGAGVVQNVRIFKSGNSLAIRIPGGIAKQLDLREGTSMEIGIDEDAVRLRRVRTIPTLQELVDSIDPDNVHEEQFPNLVGRERW